MHWMDMTKHVVEFIMIDMYPFIACTAVAVYIGLLGWLLYKDTKRKQNSSIPEHTSSYSVFLLLMLLFQTRLLALYENVHVTRISCILTIVAILLIFTYYAFNMTMYADKAQVNAAALVDY